jgi:hypothetical protein
MFKIVAFSCAVLLALCTAPLMSAQELGETAEVDAPAQEVAADLPRDCYAIALPDAEQVIAAAFRDQYPGWPAQELQALINRRSANFEVEAWLLSAGMYGDAPTDPAIAFAQHAPRFAQERAGDVTAATPRALRNLSDTLYIDRDQPDASITNNCGLVLLRAMLRANPAEVTGFLLFGGLTGRSDPRTQEFMRGYLQNVAMSAYARPEAVAYPENTLQLALDILARTPTVQ